MSNMSSAQIVSAGSSIHNKMTPALVGHLALHASTPVSYPGAVSPNHSERKREPLLRGEGGQEGVKGRPTLLGLSPPPRKLLAVDNNTTTRRNRGLVRFARRTMAVSHDKSSLSDETRASYRSRLLPRALRDNYSATRFFSSACF